MLLQVFAEGKKYYCPTIVSNFEDYLQDLKIVDEKNYRNILHGAIQNNDAFMNFYKGIRSDKEKIMDLQKRLQSDYSSVYHKHSAEDAIEYQIIPNTFSQDEALQEEVFGKLEKSNEEYKKLLNNKFIDELV